MQQPASKTASDDAVADGWDEFDDDRNWDWQFDDEIADQ